MSKHREHDAKVLTEAAARVLTALKGRGAYGRAAAVTQGEIAKVAGMNTRLLQEASLTLMEQGVPVATTCASPSGMFLAQTLSELQDYRDQLHSRIVGNAKRMRALNRIHRDWTERETVEPSGQRRLFQ